MRTALCLLLALGVSASASAQSEAYVTQAVAQANIPAVVDGSALDPFEALQAAVNAVEDGSRNVLVVEQTGVGNNAEIDQVGINNRLVLTQTGSYNMFALTQTGNDNLVLAGILGDRNDVQIIQENGGNIYELYMIGSDLPFHSVIQSGGDVARQIVAPGATPVSIEQRGGGAEVLVERY